MSEPTLSVVIPTRNRAAALARCLEALNVAADGLSVSVTVVDDASNDDTRSVLQANPWVTAEFLAAQSGSSAARNVGCARSTGEIILFVDDDIAVSEDLLIRHLRFHEQKTDVVDALVGLVTWDPHQRITRHMRWLERGGPLFAFDQITDPDDAGPEHFCTANSSVKRELLSRVKGPFDEALPRFTDVDLGLRLKASGMRLHYDSRTIAWHMRSDTPATTDERMFVVGQAAHLMIERHGEKAPVRQPGPDGLLARVKVLVARLLTPLAPVLPEGLADRIWSVRGAWAYAKGFRSAR